MDKLKDIEKFSDEILSLDDNEISFLKGDYKSGLAIYKHNYLMSLISVLRNKYSVTLQVLGEDNFKFFARFYIYSNPSTSPNIDDYGIDFDIFLSKRNELDEIGYLKYIARLDLYWFNAYENLSSPIELPCGVLDLWGKLKNSQDVKSIEIDEDTVEKITVVSEGDEIHLLAITI
jgi:hypothetical protein